VAFVPWLLALERSLSTRTGASTGFRLGLALGAAYFVGTLYWIPDVLVTYGGLARIVAVPVTGLLIAYLALFPALASWVVARAWQAHGPSAIWIAPLAWVASEWLRGWLFSGFPWVLVGTSQMSWLAIVQSVSLAGVWGLSALIVAANVAIVVAITRRPGRRLRGALTTGLLVVGLAAWGAWRLGGAHDSDPGSRLRVGIVQGNVPQDQKWSPGFADQILRRYLTLSREAAAAGARLIVWPESATPFFFEEDPVGGSAVRDLARDVSAYLLFGSDQLERGSPVRYYNAAFLVGPDGRTIGVYRKQHLVPFGEYVPLKRLLFFVAPLVDAVADFSAGTETGLMPVDGRPLSTAICYEVIFGNSIRRAVREGSQLLTTVTNDAWYGRTSAPWQHFDQAAIRAVEQGRYLVRAANTGVSGVVDPYGRVTARKGLFETGVLIQDVSLLEGRTLYCTIGDSFAWASAALCLLVLVRSWRLRPAR
jgi:apolipoprotein N-acyltransferase